MAKRIESQRTEAYRVYMSDSLALLNKSLLGGDIDYPRYLDMVSAQAVPKETAEEIKSKFDVLRRK